VTRDSEVLATVELLGAITYAQLRAFDVTASAIRHAPDVRTADRVAEFAAREHRAYLTLRESLDAHTDIPEGAMSSHRARIDEFFSGLRVADWVSACTFFAIGLPIAADFARAVAPALDEEVASAVLSALADRDTFADYAVQQVVAETEAHPEERDRIRRFAAEVTGSAFTAFQGAVTETDALLILLEEFGDGDGDLLRETAVGLLEQHRRRMHALGIDTPE
jgi:hypothetical protein